jgi:dienelactone hydrolase
VNRFEQAWNHSGVEVAGRIALFPGCEYVYIDDTIVSDSPIRIFGGRDDASADVEKCIAYGNRLRAGGADVEVTAYDGAAHGFEDPVSPAFVPLPNNRSTRDCTIVEDPAGVLINTATGQPFSNSDACVGTGTSLAFNAVAFEAVLSAVREFLAAFNPRQ